jgi:hypothetical protein
VGKCGCFEVLFLKREGIAGKILDLSKNESLSSMRPVEKKVGVFVWIWRLGKTLPADFSLPFLNFFHFRHSPIFGWEKNYYKNGKDQQQGKSALMWKKEGGKGGGENELEKLAPTFLVKFFPAPLSNAVPDGPKHLFLSPIFHFNVFFLLIFGEMNA